VSPPTADAVKALLEADVAFMEHKRSIARAQAREATFSGMAFRLRATLDALAGSVKQPDDRLVVAPLDTEEALDAAGRTYSQQPPPESYPPASPPPAPPTHGPADDEEPDW